MRLLPGVPSPDTEIAKPTLHSTDEYRKFFQDLLAYLNNRVPATGTVTFAAATTAAVTFTTAEPDANYDIWPISTDSKTYWASSKTTAGFTMNASASSSATIRYQLIRA